MSSDSSWTNSAKNAKLRCVTASLKKVPTAEVGEDSTEADQELEASVRVSVAEPSKVKHGYRVTRSKAWTGQHRIHRDG